MGRGALGGLGVSTGGWSTRGLVAAPREYTVGWSIQRASRLGSGRVDSSVPLKGRHARGCVAGNRVCRPLGTAERSTRAGCAAGTGCVDPGAPLKGRHAQDRRPDRRVDRWWGLDGRHAVPLTGNWGVSTVQGSTRQVEPHFPVCRPFTATGESTRRESTRAGSAVWGLGVSTVEGRHARSLGDFAVSGGVRRRPLWSRAPTGPTVVGSGVCCPPARSCSTSGRLRP